MRATILSKNGVVVLHDLNTKQDIIAMTAAEASWLSFFLQKFVTSEVVVKLRLASFHAEKELLKPIPELKEFTPYV